MNLNCYVCFVCLFVFYFIMDSFEPNVIVDIKQKKKKKQNNKIKIEVGSDNLNQNGFRKWDWPKVEAKLIIYMLGQHLA